MKKIFFISGLIFATTVAAFASDASPKYVEKQGRYCYVPEDCFGSFIPAEGAAQANCGESYISPIMCAMLDLYNMHINPKYPDPTDPFEHPLIQGNTREHAREIALSLITENKNNAVNDCFQSHGSCATPLWIAARIGDVELVKLILAQGGDKNTVVGDIRRGKNILQQMEKFSTEVRDALSSN